VEFMRLTSAQMLHRRPGTPRWGASAVWGQVWGVVWDDVSGVLVVVWH
jgi:hypothetical protein